MFRTEYSCWNHAEVVRSKEMIIAGRNLMWFGCMEKLLCSWRCAFVGIRVPGVHREEQREWEEPMKCPCRSTRWGTRMWCSWRSWILQYFRSFIRISSTRMRSLQEISPSLVSPILILGFPCGCFIRYSCYWMGCLGGPSFPSMRMFYKMIYLFEVWWYSCVILLHPFSSIFWRTCQWLFLASYSSSSSLSHRGFWLMSPYCTVSCLWVLSTNLSFFGTVL